MNKEQIKALIKKLNVRPSAQMYDRTLLDTLEAQRQKVFKKNSTTQRPKIWRLIAAAVIALAIVFVLLSPFGTSDSGSVVWAKVAQNMDNAQRIVHKEHRIYYELGEEKPFLKADVIKHCYQKLGVVEEQYSTEGDLMHRAYVLGKQREVVFVLAETKKYLKVPLNDGMAQIIDRLTPRGLVEHFMTIEHKKLGRTRIDGSEVEGVEVIDTDIWPIPDKFDFLFPVKKITWRMWIDIENSLPVRIEMEVITDRALLLGMKKLKVVCKAYDFEYHHTVREELFEPNIPNDYTEFILTDFLPVKAGLGFLCIIPVGFVFCKRSSRKRIIANQHE